jgi:quercetin dioxygenase-like cupin family protein
MCGGNTCIILLLQQTESMHRSDGHLSELGTRRSRSAEKGERKLSKEKNMSQGNEPYVLSQGEGQAIWFLGTLVNIKAVGENTHNAFALLESVNPPGTEPPPHIHHHQDEALYILEGTMTIHCGDRTWKATAGSFVFLPRGIVHSFTVEGGTPAKVLILTSPSGPSGFEHFVQEMGEPAKEQVLPPAGAPDMEKLLSLPAKYHLEIRGPASELQA